MLVRFEAHAVDNVCTNNNALLVHSVPHCRASPGAGIRGAEFETLECWKAKIHHHVAKNELCRAELLKPGLGSMVHLPISLK